MFSAMPSSESMENATRLFLGDFSQARKPDCAWAKLVHVPESASIIPDHAIAPHTPHVIGHVGHVVDHFPYAPILAHPIGLRLRDRLVFLRAGHAGPSRSS